MKKSKKNNEKWQGLTPADCDCRYCVYYGGRKKNNRYSFEDRVLSQNADCKLQEILEYEQGWNCVRDEYIKLKNHNRDTNKKSFILYLESIHNVYNHIQQSLEDEEDNLPRGLTYLNPW